MESSGDLANPVSKFVEAQRYDLHQGEFRASLVKGAPHLTAGLHPVPERMCQSGTYEW